MEKKTEPIRLKPECITCLVKSRLNKYPDHISVEEKIDYMQNVMKEIANLPKHYSAPVAVRAISRIQKEMFGQAEDYREIKRYFNDLLMKKVPELVGNIKNAKDPLKLAIQYAMTGSYIDFGAFDRVDEKMLEDFFEKAKENPVNELEYESLKVDLKNAKRIVYLLDNCGEAVVDKLLISVLREQNPDAKITVIVRGSDVLNDATMEDAVQIGLHEVAEVIGNGTDIAGTCLDEISEEAREIIDLADVILAKGQGNFETLQNCGKNIYYIFMCKCEMFAKRFQVPQFCGMLINDKNVK